MCDPVSVAPRRLVLHMAHFVQLSHIRLADCVVADKTRGAELADASLAADVRAGAV